MEAETRDVVVRRRGWLMALIALASAVVAAGYLWHFSSSGSGVELLVGAALACVAVAHGLAWADARRPLMVADATGVRVRLGSQWAGTAWDGLERVEVEPRGRVSDGHLALIVADEPTALVAASRRSRIAAALNRHWYDSSLVVPFGLTTTVSHSDVAEAVSRLADGRTPVHVLDGGDEEPVPTVEVKQVPASAQERMQSGDPATPTTVGVGADAVAADHERAGEPVLVGAGVVAGGVPAELTSSGAGSDGASALSGPSEPKRRRRLFVARHTEERSNGGSPAERSVEPLRMAARRAEVTMPTRSDPATTGMFAHSHQALAAQPAPGEESAASLPEIEALRRPADPDSTDGQAWPARDGGAAGNVSLIIDATTDLSAQAMQRVRRPVERRERTAAPVVPTSGGADTEAPALLIGHHVSEARHQLRLTVDDLAERTRIRPYVIESIEADDFSPCGGDFYARGHLRMLARVLGIEAAPLISLYDEHFASSPLNARDVFEVELAHGSTGIIRAGSPGANWGALIAAVLVLLLVWGVARYVSERSDSGPGVAEPTQNAAGLGSPGPGNAPLTQPHRVRVHVTATGGESRVVVWDRFRNVVFRGTVSDGTTEVVAGRAPLRVMAVNGGVISLKSRGTDLGPLGAAGERSKQVVHAASRTAD